MRKVRFREARMAAGFTLREAGRRFGKTASALQRWESGQNSPTVPDIYQMSDLYRVGIEELFGEVKRPYPIWPPLDKELTTHEVLKKFSRKAYTQAEKARAKELAEVAQFILVVPDEFTAHWIKALKACASAVARPTATKKRVYR